MDIFITGVIGMALGLSAGLIIGARSAARKCGELLKKELKSASIGFEIFEFNVDEKGNMTSVKVPGSYVEKFNMDIKSKGVVLPKDFGKMKDEVETTPAVKTPEKKKRVSKPRTAAQRKQARDRMRIYRAKKKASQK